LAGIFISYRRDDSAGYSGRLFADLKQRFGQDQIFIDVVGIALGRDFRKVIDQKVSGCDVLLVVIGRNWAGASAPGEASRLQDPKDLVRIEVVSALKRDIPVVPVLVDGATIPRHDQLPADLEPLAWRNAIELRHERWDDDVGELMDALDQIVAKAPNRQVAPRDESPNWRRPLGIAAVLALALAGGLALFWSLQNRVWPTPTPTLTPTAQPVTPEAPASPAVPDVVGLSEAAAHEALASAGLTAGEVTRRADPRSSGTVLEQLPAAGSRVAPGSSVKLVLAETLPPPTAIPSPEATRRPQATTFRMPDVKRSDMRSSAALLDKLGLKVTGQPLSVKRDVTIGTVLDQVPIAGAEVQKGDTVLLSYVGEVLVSVPNLVGLDVNSAKDRLHSAGLRWKPTGEGTTTTRPGFVIRQDPAPDTDVKKGSEVGFVYAVAPEGREQDNCLRGFVWRKAYHGDQVCVTPEVRDQAARDNREAASHAGPYRPGRGNCEEGYRWRLANRKDQVCVPDKTWEQTQDDNKSAPSRVVRGAPGGH
jgi:beta-lactam-binding protein with PASTA domain